VTSVRDHISYVMMSYDGCIMPLMLISKTERSYPVADLSRSGTCRRAARGDSAGTVGHSDGGVEEPPQGITKCGIERELFYEGRLAGSAARSLAAAATSANTYAQRMEKRRAVTKMTKNNHLRGSRGSP